MHINLAVNRAQNFISHISIHPIAFHHSLAIITRSPVSNTSSSYLVARRADTCCGKQHRVGRNPTSKSSQIAQFPPAQPAQRCSEGNPHASFCDGSQGSERERELGRRRKQTQTLKNVALKIASILSSQLSVSTVWCFF